MVAAAAAADAKVRSPPPPPALSRSIAASLARTHRRVSQAVDAAVTGLLLVKVAGDTSLCAFLAAAWLLAASVATVDLGRVFYGDYDCALVAAGARVLCLAALAIGTFCAPAILVFVHRVALPGSDTDDAEGQGPRPRGLATAVEEVLGNCGVTVGLLAGLLFHVLTIVGDLLKGFSPSKGSPMEELGSQMRAVGTLGKDVVWCFVIIPTVALMVWRVTRSGWRCHSGLRKPLEVGKVQGRWARTKSFKYELRTLCR